MSFNSRHLLLLTSCLSAIVPQYALSNPENGVVAAGAATIHSAGNTLTINQSTDRAVIDWRRFNIAPNETTRFNQPSSTSHTLNRVNDTSRSVIDGTITANGNITIVNPNGVFFSRGSVVDVAGLTATSADTSNANFMAGRVQHDIAGNANAKIINEGSITVRDAGLAAFVAPGVENHGSITARLGKVNLAAGETFALDMAGDGHMQVGVNADTLHTQVANSGMIVADGGSVLLTTGAARNVVDSLITNTGVIEAKSIGTKAGKVVLYAEGSNAVKNNIAANKGVRTGSSTVIQGGTINVSGSNAGERGGKVEVLGDNIALTRGSLINASGHSGGGDIKVGGDYLGSGTTAAAKRVLVESGATITNNATHSGNGGRTIFWSDDRTQFAGTVSATSLNGIGGFTEVSGKNMLGFTGSVDLRSANGSNGTLLLDPTNITISTAADTGTMTFGGGAFTDTAVGTSNLNTTTLATQLGLSNVIVSTASAQGSAGDITVSDAISWASGFGLTLLADNNITLNAGITNSGAGSLTLTAGGDGAGNIDISNGANISVGGPLTLTATGGSITLADADLAATGITINNALSYNGTAGITRTMDARTGTLTVGNSGSITAGNRSFYTYADDADIRGAISAVGGDIRLFSTTNGLVMGFGGAAGNYQLSDAELDLFSGTIIGFYNGGSIDLAAHDWNNNIGYRLVLRGSDITVSGDQNFNSAGAYRVSFYANGTNGYTVNAALNTNNAKDLTFSGPNIFEIGAGAAASGLGTAELDRISNGWSSIQLGGETNNTAVFAYSNWRDPIQVFGNDSLTISGAQAAAAGSDASYTIKHAYNTGAGPVITADVDMSAAANGYGSITLDGWGHTGVGSAFQLGANLISGTAGIAIYRPVTLTGAAGTSRTINAGTGSINILNNGTTTFGSISTGTKYLTLRADSMDIGGAITGIANYGLTINKHSLSRAIGLAGAAAGLDLSVAELDRITGFTGISFGPTTNTNTSSTTINAYNWSRFTDYVYFVNDGYGVININGAQTFAASQVAMSGDYNITAAISNIGGQLLFGRSLSDVTLGGNNAASWLNSTELDFIADGSSALTFSSGNLTMEAYNNWRDPVLVQGSGVNKTLTISGAQTAATGTNASITLGNVGGYQYFNTIDINANLDMSGSTTGGISIVGRPNTVFAPGTATLNADLTSGADGITIDRAVTLAGAAGTTRTINANSGTLTINNNGTTQTGSINIGDKNLNLIADNMTIGGTVSGTGTLYIRGFDQNRTIGLAGGAGDLQLDNTELDLLTVSGGQSFGHWSGVGRSQRGITVGARTWGTMGSLDFSNLGGTGFTTTGAQDFGSAAVFFFGAQDFVIGDTIAGTGSLNFYAYNGSVGGAAGTTKLDSVELDRLANGFGSIRFGYNAGGNITFEAYNNWRDGVYIDNVGTLTMNGAQTAAAGSDAYMLLSNTGGSLTINSDIDMSGSTGGTLAIYAAGANTATLGANLTSGSNGIYIARATSLTGAAGTTRTLNAGTGALTIANDGATTHGELLATNKNLTVIADSIALTGGISSTTGNITLKPFTNARTVGLGTGAGLFSIDTSELALLDAGSGTLTLGSSTGTGAYEINTNHVFDEHVVFDTNTGVMTLASNLSSNAKNMNFSTDVGKFRISGNHTISTLGSGDLTFASLDGAMGSEIVYVTSDGSLNITGASGTVNAFDELHLTSQGAMALGDITSGSLFAQTLGVTSDITLNGVLTMLNNGTAIDLASGDDIINNHGAGVFVLNGGARFLTWSDDPLQDTGEEHFGISTARYSVNYGDSVPTSDSFRNYSVADPSTPVIYPPAFTVPDSVLRVLADSSILGSYASHSQTAGTNASANQSASNAAGSSEQNAVIYDETTGDKVATLLESIQINPAVMKAFGLTYTSPKDI